jgi:hypothetical protein
LTLGGAEPQDRRDVLVEMARDAEPRAFMAGPLARFGLLITALPIATACAVPFVDSGIDVAHSRFAAAAAARREDVSVRPFHDLRPEEKRSRLGGMRNSYGVVSAGLKTSEDQQLGVQLARAFGEALGEAGYRAALDPGGPPDSRADFHPVATLEGDIEKFWLDSYLVAWQRISIRLRLLDRTEALLWEARVEGRETNMIWLGLKAEYRALIRSALDQALAQAIEEFESPSFEAQIRAAAEGARTGSNPPP